MAAILGLDEGRGDWTRSSWQRDPWRNPRAIAEQARREASAAIDEFARILAKHRHEERLRLAERLQLERRRRVRARPVAVLSTGRVHVPLVRSRGQAPRAPRA